MKIHDSRQTQLKRILFLAASVLLNLTPNATHASVVGFEELSLAQNSYWNGSSRGATGFGTFTSGGAILQNYYSTADGSWNGFAYSNVKNSTTPGWENQYAAWPGSGTDSSSKYVVAYQETYGPIAPLTITLGSDWNFEGRGLQVANTTYAAIDMLHGSQFSKKFGGDSLLDQDWFRLTIQGSKGGVDTGTVNFYLADYRFTDSAQDYILNSWAFVDLSPVGIVDTLRFSLTSSDPGTPNYVALDNLGSVPEPCSASLLLLAALGLAVVSRARRATQS